MEDEELPSESTTQPSSRRNLLKNTTSTEANRVISSFAKAHGEKDRLAPAKTKKRRLKEPKRSASSKTKKPSLHSTPKKKLKRPLPIFDEYSGSDDDIYEDYEPSTDPKSTSNKSRKQDDPQVKENSTALNISFASDATNTDGSNDKSEAKSKTTGHTKEDVMKYFTKQLNGEFKCNLCINSPKVKHLSP